MTFPVTESTLSASHLGLFLQEPYKLSSNTTCALFRTGINHLYLVTDGHLKFVFRIYTFNWRTKSEVAEELRLLNHLKENSIPVSYPIADQAGCLMQEIDAPEGKRFGVLFSFAPGKKIARFSPEASYAIGMAMAKMHQVSENYALDRVTYCAATLLADSLIRTQSFFTSPSDEMTFVEEATQYLTQEYEKVKTIEVRKGAIHLDIWFDNMHFEGENNITIFDFDFCGNGWLCHDVAYFMFQLYNTNQNENEYEEKVLSFLNGYETISRLSEEEKRIIPMISVAIFLFYLGVQCDRFDNWSNIFLNEDHLKRFIGMIKRWMIYNKFSLK